ncbi:MAG TPA: hypothetical protein VK067_09070 [Pseudogracilibacillus sp.]|nr:hypothetical protein [Pseudogracilibacillus sp.]
MAKELKGSLYMIYSNYFYSLLTFWAVLVGIVGISIVFAYIYPGSESYFTLSAPSYFYGPIVGAMLVTGIVPYLIKLGVTRFSLFVSIGIFGLVVTIVNSLVVQVIQKILTLIFKETGSGHLLLANGESTLVLNHIAEGLAVDTWWTRIVIDTSLAFFFLAIAFFIALIFYRYGKLGGFLFLAAIAAVMIFGMSSGGFLYQLFERIFTTFSFHYFYYLFGIGIVIYGLSYLILHGLTIKQ